MNRTALAILAALVVAAPACRGPDAEDRGGNEIARLVDSLRPAVEHAVGLRFLRQPLSATRSREQVRAYILHKLDSELPPDKAKGLQAAYRLLGMFPDTLELRPLLLDLLTEQIVGFYEPDSTTLFVVAGADPQTVRVVVAHEMIHALQHQYTPLDSIMHQRNDNDRLSAAQAVLEGQATLGGLQVIVPKQNVIAMPEFWETYRETIRNQQATMPVFARAPRVIREGVIFPYLAGADFMRWWAGSEHHDTVPFGRLMPTSTEQILHPYRYNRGDQPIGVRFRPQPDRVWYEDVLGEFEIRLLSAELFGSSEISTPIAIGWGGDRYQVYNTDQGPAMVWYTVWDDIPSQFRFITGIGQRLETKRRLGYRMEITPIPLQTHPAVRVVIAPVRWAGWKRIPEAEIPQAKPPADSAPGVSAASPPS